jgi:HSP20 family molecular chaperone IbpA
MTDKNKINVEDLFRVIFGEPTEKEKKSLEKLAKDLSDYKSKSKEIFDKDKLKSNLKCSDSKFAGFKMENMTDGDGVKLTYYIPSLTKNDISITVSDNIVHVVGKKIVPCFGELDCKVKMKFDVDNDKITAKVENGVLTINVFKVKTLPTKEYSINID